MGRVAILMADTPIDPVKEQYGTYGDIFERLFTQGGLDPAKTKFEKYDVVTKQEYPSDIAHLEGVIITGSRHTSYHDDPWILKLVEFTKKLVNEGVKIVGICFGHQIIARALGAPVTSNSIGWELSSTKIDWTPEGEKLFSEVANSGSAHIMQMHRDIVTELPANTKLLSSTEKCSVQGFYRPHAFVTLQGHPEFQKVIVKELVDLRAKTGVITQDMADDALSRVAGPNDGPGIAKGLARFISDEKL